MRNDLFQKLGQRKPLVVGLAFLVVLAVAVVALVMPKKAAVKEQQKLLDQAQAQTSQLQAQVRTLLQDRHDAPQVRAELKKLDAEMPGVVKLPTIIRQIKAMANDAAVDFVQIQPNVPAAATTGNYSMVPTQIGATGSYFAVTEFLYRLETLSRAVKIMGVALSPLSNGGPHGVTQLQLQLNTDVFTTDTSAGPGSVPGHTAPSTTSTTTVPTTTASPTTGGA